MRKVQQDPVEIGAVLLSGGHNAGVSSAVEDFCSSRSGFAACVRNLRDSGSSAHHRGVLDEHHLAAHGDAVSWLE